MALPPAHAAQFEGGAAEGLLTSGPADLTARATMEVLLGTVGPRRGVHQAVTLKL